MKAAVDDVEHAVLRVGDLDVHVAMQGRGPLLLLLHGFPETWYSWRHQFAPLAALGFRVVAPDQRGYAGTDQPEDPGAYTLLHLVGDVLELIRVLGEDQAVVVGHDWGAIVAWTTALLRPDAVRGVAGLSVPPILPAGMPSVASSRSRFGSGFYQNYFQEPGTAEVELAADPETSLRRILVGGSGDGVGASGPKPWVVPPDATLLGALPEPARLPHWLTAQDLAVFSRDLGRHGARAFTGALNWYRNIDRNHELLAAFDGLEVVVPSLYVVGDRDMVAALGPPPKLERLLPRLHAAVSLPGCGHWTQQERPEETTAAITDFVTVLPPIGEA